MNVYYMARADAVSYVCVCTYWSDNSDNKKVTVHWPKFTVTL